MAYGLAAYSSSGNIQISEDYPVLQVLASGTIAAGSWGTALDGAGGEGPSTYLISSLLSTHGITVPSGEAIQIFVRPSSAPTGVTSGTSAIYWLNATVASYICGHQAVNTDYVLVGLADWLNTPPSGNYGLEIYDTDGSTLIFTSNLPIWKHTTAYLATLQNTTPTYVGQTVQSSTSWSSIDYALLSQHMPSAQSDLWHGYTTHPWTISSGNLNLWKSGIGAWFKFATPTYYYKTKYTWMEDLDLTVFGDEGNGTQDMYNNGNIYCFAGTPGD